MRLLAITAVLCVASACALAEVAPSKAAEAKLIGRLPAGGKQHKRGILSHVPPFKLGHDIAHVTHSFVKPVLVTYPPTAAVASVKVPYATPLGPRYPAGVGHKVAGLPHPHYALRFPHTKYYAKPDHYFHHHHHHVEPKPIVPVLPPPPPVIHAAPVDPVLPGPRPSSGAPALHNAALPPQPVPLAPPPVAFPHSHLRPLLSAASFPLAPAAHPHPVFPLQQQYVIRPGAAVQASYFATYPRYPLLNSYQAPLFPLHNAAPALPTLPTVPPVQSVHRVVQAPGPHFQVLPQAVPQEVPGVYHPTVVYQQSPTLLHSSHEVPQPTVHVPSTEEALPNPTFSVQPTQLIPQPPLQLQPTQPAVPVEHDGWSPVLANPENQLHYPQQGHQFVQQQQGAQVYEQHNFQHQIQQHIQQQIEQAQYEQNLHNQQHLQQEYGAPHVPHDYAQSDQQHFVQHGHDLPQHGYDFSQLGPDFSQQGPDFTQQGHDFSQQGPDFTQQGHDFSQQGHDFSQQGHGYSQQGHDFSQQGQEVSQAGQQPSPEYGLPEGRSSDDDTQQYHNHIPLALQPPIDRPLDHFR